MPRHHEPPKRLIRFIGKAGFISRDLWRKFFFDGGKERWMRREWENLVLRGYCLPHPERHLRNVYVLNRFNPVVRDIVGGRFVAPQRATYFEHDEFLYHGLLLAERSGFIADWKSEGELKVAKGKEFRIESGDKAPKYPDALVFPAWVTNAKPIAIEYERTLKGVKRYGQIMASYGGMKGLGSVLYITDSAAVQSHVKQGMLENFYPERDRPVEFVSTETWTQKTKELFASLCRNRTAAAQPKNA